MLNYYDIFQDSLRKIMLLIENNKHIEDLSLANNHAPKIIDGIGSFVQLIILIQEDLKSFLQKNDNKSEILNLKIHLLYILKELSKASKNNDIVAMRDLIENELIDNLTKWKIHFIPLLINKNQKANSLEVI